MIANKYNIYPIYLSLNMLLYSFNINIKLKKIKNHVIEFILLINVVYFVFFTNIPYKYTNANIINITCVIKKLKL